MTRLLALLLALVVLSATIARAEERITDFDSRVVVAPSGALTITEWINVESEGREIRHGIFRDFPTTYTTPEGLRVRVGFKVVSVDRDGHSEPYTVAAIDAGERVRIGSPGVEIRPGAHSYAIVYTTDQQIGFFGDYDELYWNATGNFWRFPIDHATATVVLPPGGKILQFAAYTGAAGSTARNARADRISDREITFQTTAPLGRAEGLTVAVGFAKGAVTPPTAIEKGIRFLRSNASTVAAVAGLLVLLAYFVYAWLTHARRPRHGVIIPLFEPPRDFSPGAVRFVREMAYDRKAYAASLIDMAVKGYLTIAEASRVYTLTRTGKSESETGLAHGEAAIANQLFARPLFGQLAEALLAAKAGVNAKAALQMAPAFAPLEVMQGLVAANTDVNAKAAGGACASIELTASNHYPIAESVTALKTSLKNEYERSYFVTNRTWFFGGLAILLVSGGVATVTAEGPAEWVWFCVFFIASAFLLGIFHRFRDAAETAINGPGSRVLNSLRALFWSTLFTLLLSGCFVLMARAPRTLFPAMAALGAGWVVSYIFYHLLKAPTLAGAKVLDQIEGFRLFLATAEKDRLEALNPPNVTPQVFERFLPYAIALDCENEWSGKFELEAAAAGLPRGSSGGYDSPQWYSGSSFGGALSPGDFAGGLTESLAAAAASAAAVPGSVSGSGGGGFSGGGGSSGGGGGGGGGGGW